MDMQLNRETRGDGVAALGKETFPSYSEKILPIAAGYPERFPVPAAQRLWEREFSGYQPVFYESPRVLAMDRTVVPGGWADPAQVSREEFHILKSAGALKSYEGEVRLDPETGRPMNPAGRTGISGRGLLGKWGANQAADALLTRVNADTGVLEALLIERDNGEWAIPGGMLDAGEDALTAARRELQEEAGVDLEQSSGKLIYQGLGDGPRTTDNAWIETTLYHFHLEASHPAACGAPKAGSDARGADWTPITHDLISSLYSNHGELVSMALSQLRVNHPTFSSTVIEQLEQVPHALTLTSFSQLQGRIGIFGGTFDPVQSGHIYAAHAAMRQHDLDAIVFVPAAQNPIKQHAPGALGRERFDMVCKAIGADNRNFFVSPFEIRKGDISYTVDTVRSIRQELPQESSLFFILGSDCLADLPQWHGVEELKMMAEFIPVKRPGTDDLVLTRLGGALGEDFVSQLICNSVEGLGVDISSSDARRRIAEGESLEDMLPGRVSSYIAARNLYHGGVGVRRE